MEKKTNKVSYSVSLVFNPSMPKTIRTEEKVVQVYNKTTHKQENRVLSAQKVEDTPYSVPGILHILNKAGIEINKKTSDYLVILYSEEYEIMAGENLKHSMKVANKAAYTEARSKIMTKVDEIKKLLKGLNVVVILHDISEDEKPKMERKKKPSGNKKPGSITTSYSKRKHNGKFGPKDKQRVPRKEKKRLQKDTVAKVMHQIGEMEGLSQSQLKRKRLHDTILDFVNAWCDKDFKSYTEAMKFVRDNRNKKEIESKLAA